MVRDDWEGFEEAFKVLDNVSNEISHRGLSAAANKALRPAANTARQKYRSETKGTQEGYSKSLAVSRMIRVVRQKLRFAPGANLYIDMKLIPVGEREWPARLYAMLLAFGSKNRNTKGGANRGSVKGKGDFIVESGKENSNIILSTFKKLAIPEVEKAIQKTIAKYGKK